MVPLPHRLGRVGRDGLVVGYINIEGLNASKWELCRHLIDDGVFDLLFMAETWWQAGWREYQQHRSWIACSIPYGVDDGGSDESEPHLQSRRRRGREGKQKPGRRHGGIFLIGSPEAKKLVLSGDVIKRGEHFVSVVIADLTAKVRISGVYFPPSLDDDEMARLLEEPCLRASDMVLGDINVRFSYLRSQKPGSVLRPGRSGVMRMWMASMEKGMQPAEPTLEEPVWKAAGAASRRHGGNYGLGKQLNLIHCLLTPAVSPYAQLRLVECDSLDVDECLQGVTHRHAAQVTVDLVGLARATDVARRFNFASPAAAAAAVIRRPFEDEMFVPMRFSVAKMRARTVELGTEGIRSTVEEAFTEVYRPIVWNTRQTVDVLNEAVIEMLQYVACRLSGEPVKKKEEDAEDGSNKRKKSKKRKKGKKETKGNGAWLPVHSSAASYAPAPRLPDATMVNSLQLSRDTRTTASRLFKESMRANPVNIQTLPPEGIDKDPLEVLRSRLAYRYAASKPSRQRLSTLLNSDGRRLGSPMPLDVCGLAGAFSRESIAEEVRGQVLEKSCGGDGVHIYLLKSLMGTRVLDLLEMLYQRCTAAGHTPRAWNSAEVHLLSKDPTAPRRPDNLRPVTLVSVVRKVFERLLLEAVQGQCWTALHPAQAGFRAGYSVETNAALVHHALSSGRARVAVFIDIKSAFDVVDHSILVDMLDRRLCARPVLRLLVSLTMADVDSRVLVNGRVSAPFRRTRGLLQGSPLSPLLFNVYIDGLVRELNGDEEDEDLALFYADDGVVLASSFEVAQELLLRLQSGLRRLRMRLNLAKCNYVCQEEGGTLFLMATGKREVLLERVEQSTYLGFPCTAGGIDFLAHVHGRMEAAAGLTSFLSIYSDKWGVSERLELYRRHLAPMFEYGAVLVHAWCLATKGSKRMERTVRGPWLRLIRWIVGCKVHAHLVASNLLGLISPQERFSHIHAKFQLVRARLDADNPLHLLLLSSSSDRGGGDATRFLHHLQKSALYGRSQRQGPESLDIDAFLKKERRAIIEKNVARGGVCLKASPVSSRRVPGHPMADNVLAAPVADQNLLFMFRVNMGHRGYQCKCGKKFQRTHIEEHGCLTLPFRVDDARKRAQFGDGVELAKISSLDYWIVVGDLEKAVAIMRSIRQQLVEKFTADSRSPERDL